MALVISRDEKQTLIFKPTIPFKDSTFLYTFRQTTSTVKNPENDSKDTISIQSQKSSFFSIIHSNSTDHDEEFYDAKEDCFSKDLLESVDMHRTNTAKIKDYDEIVCIQAMVHKDAVDTNE